MNYNEKRKAKKMAVLGFTMSYVMTVIMVVNMILLPVLNFSGDNTTAYSNVVIAWSLLISLLSAIFFMIMGQRSANKRNAYLRKINDWRNHTFFNRCLNALLRGDFDTAVEYHSDKLLKDKYLRRFLWGFGVHAFLVGDDDDKREFAEKAIKNLRKDFNPDNLF